MSFGNLFNPDAKKNQDQEKVAIRRECERVRQLALGHIPAEFQEGLHVNVTEVVCGDPTCAPIDTMIQLTWQAGLSKPLGIPKSSAEVTEEDVEDVFAEESVDLEAWSAGKEHVVVLRFEVGSRVECRIGADPVTGWGAGTVVKQQYREANWPPGVFAPYQIQLDDGRLIFAPHDADQVIRKLQGGDGGGEDGGAEGGGGGAQSMPPMPEHDAEDDGNMF